MGTSIPAHYEYGYGNLSNRTQSTEILLNWNGVRYVKSAGKTTILTSNERRVATQKLVSKSSVATPNFRSIVKKGGLLPTNGFYHGTRTTTHRVGFLRSTVVEDGITKAVVSNTGFLGSGWPYVDSITLPSVSEMDSLDREVRTKIRLAIKDQAVNIAQIIAERDKTTASVAKIVATIAQIITKLRKGDLAGAGAAVGKHVGWKKRKQHSRQHKSDPAGAMSNAWLEFQYAVMPLLMDAEGLAIALGQYQFKPITGQVTATRKKEFSSKKVTGTINSSGGRIYDTTSGFVSIKYTVFWRASLPDLPNFAALGLTNPAQLAWELFPFSFVIDWLLPIGNYLSSFDATLGMEFSDGSVSTKTKAIRNMVLTKNHRGVSGSTVSTDEAEIGCSFEIDEVNRVKLNAFPQIGLPSFKDPTSLKHLATSMALLYKAIRS